MRHITITKTSWPVNGSFRISRSTLTEIPVVTANVHDGAYVGRGECRPYARYGESPECVIEELESVRKDIEQGLETYDLQRALPPGAARNALDCALWDLKAKIVGTSVSQLLGLREPQARTTAFTLSVDTPENMANAAREASQYPLLKIKVGNEDGLACCLAVLDARPDAQLIIDANEALSAEELQDFQHALTGRSVVLIEQPLPAKSNIKFAPDLHPIICADEALHTQKDLDRLWSQGYRAINVKLDKCGGLTQGLALMRKAKSHGFQIMAGCMVGSSLAMAPMMVLEQFADVIDLDGPLLLSRDIKNGLKYDGPIVHPARRDLWG